MIMIEMIFLYPLYLGLEQHASKKEEHQMDFISIAICWGSIPFFMLILAIIKNLFVRSCYQKILQINKIVTKKIIFKECFSFFCHKLFQFGQQLLLNRKRVFFQTAW
jgi:hypothetical protein